MTEPEQFKELADTFLMWASTASTEIERKDLLSMARTCIQAAADTGSISARQRRQTHRKVTSL